MYEKLMTKIENGDFDNFKQALAEIKLRYDMGLLTKDEYFDCRDYAIFLKSSLNKQKFNNEYVVLY